MYTLHLTILYASNSNQIHSERATWLNILLCGISLHHKANSKIPHQDTNTESSTIGIKLQLIQTLLSDFLKTFSINKCCKALDPLFNNFCVCIKNSQAIFYTAINATPTTRVQQYFYLINKIVNAVMHIECILLAVNKKQIAAPNLFHTCTSYAAVVAAVVVIATAS